MALTKTPECGYKFYPKPNYPDVPFAELDARITKVQQLMAENNIECLVLWSDPNVRYFFGFESIHWRAASIQPAVGIIPNKGEPVLIMPEFFRGSAECQCWTRNILGQEDIHQPKAQRELPVEVANVIKELGYASKNIGLEMGPMGCMYIPRPLNDIKAFEGALGDAKFVDGDAVIWGCRMIKSPLEITRIRTAVNALAAIEAALVEEYRPGMTEIDLSIIVQRKAAELGNGYLGASIGLQGSFRAALNKEPMADIGVHEGATIGKGDYIFFDMDYSYKGYNPDSARIFQIGPVTKRMMELYELVWACEDKAEAILKPGIKANELWQEMYDPIRAAGLPVLDMGGHGKGLGLEPPSIDAWCEIPIEEGMVLSIEPWVYEHFKMKGGDGKFGIQDQFAVTKKGCEKIEGLRRDIVQVSHPILEKV
ncbi:M24 family metallopeptidase [Chloroflexota bacterium]